MATTTKQLCMCSWDNMSPEYAPNLQWGEKLCESCKGIVTWYMNNQYNRYNGYSGYDEENEHDNDNDEGDDDE